MNVMAAIMESRGMTRRDMVRATGLSRSYVNLILRGCVPSEKTAGKIADALEYGGDPMELFADAGKPAVCELPEPTVADRIRELVDAKVRITRDLERVNDALEKALSEIGA